MSAVYFNEAPDHTEILDGWMDGESGETVVSNVQKQAVGGKENDRIGLVGGKENDRIGLGFTEKRSRDGYKNDKQDKFGKVANINKRVNDKAKKVGNIDDSSSDEDELHGVVEKDISRTNIKPINASKNKNRTSSNQTKRSTENQVDLKCTTKAEEYTELDSRNAEIKDVGTSKSASEKESGEVIRENHRKRNRTKTRSKQKNIRRDNRPESSKPAHLQAGSKDFQGRELTEVTKQMIGVKSKKAKTK